MVNIQKAWGHGYLNILAFNGKVWTQKRIIHVLNVSQLKYNLFSAGVAIDKDQKLETYKIFCKFVMRWQIGAVGGYTWKLFNM